MNEAEITRVADEILGRELARAGFDHASVESGLDHEDQPALFIVAHVTNSDERTNAPLFSDAHVSVLKRLREMGETRFPYLSFRFRDDDDVADQASTAASGER